jgi:hypothetical protein
MFQSQESQKEVSFRLAPENALILNLCDELRSPRDSSVFSGQTPVVNL